MLEVSGLSVRYGAVAAVRNVGFACGAGELVSIIGPNGAGKSSTLLAIAGACKGTVSGSVSVDGRRVDTLPPERRARHGVALVPEGRRIFTRLTVEENLRLASRERGEDQRRSVDRVYDRFPVLADFSGRHAGLLSGGQQQQLAIGRALMGQPSVLLMDEPSLGLSPLMVERVFEAITDLRGEGLAIVLVEQNAKRASEMADRTLVLRGGAVAGEGEKAVDSQMIDAFFGGVRPAPLREETQDGQ